MDVQVLRMERAGRDWTPHFRETTANFTGISRFRVKNRLENICNFIDLLRCAA
jgi:hypothetical protein